MSYEDDCKVFHENRKSAIHSAWKKFLRDTPSNRGVEDKVFTTLTDFEIILVSDILQRYLQKEG